MLFLSSNINIKPFLTIYLPYNICSQAVEAVLNFLALGEIFAILEVFNFRKWNSNVI